MRKWQEFEHNSQFYYDESDGLVIGHVHKFGNMASIHTATVKCDNVDKTLGQYITVSYAKKAVEQFWDIQDRTLLEYNAE
jgi:hypothetical protein